MNRHTSGPWRVEILPGGKRGSGAQIMIASPIPVKPIVVGIPQGTEEHLANMRLIAAAPELLEALKKAFVLPRPWIDGGVTWPEWDAAFAAIEAAIAKAEGGR